MALAFRLGWIEPAATRSTLVVSEDDLRTGPADLSGIGSLWANAGIPNEAAWATGLGLAVEPGEGAPQLTGDPLPDTAHDASVVSDTGQITLDRSNEAAPFLQVVAPHLRMLVGRVAGRRIEVGDISMEVAPGPKHGFANLSLVALDGLPIGESRRVLLTAVARVENTGAMFDADRTTLGPDWGPGPTLCEPVPLTLEMPGTGWSCTALTGAGGRGAAVGMDGSRLTLGPNSGSLWFLLERE